MMNFPKISIITPSYNQGRFLEDTILSVLNQNYPNLEYIIIDGGSTDNSIEIIKKYEKHLTYWISEKDKGQSAAINKGFGKSTGEILAYLNSDDTYCEGALQIVGEFFKNNHETDLFYGNSIFTNEKNEPIGIWKTIKYNFQIHMYGGSIIPQPSAFWRRDIFFNVGGLNEDLQFAMDGDLWFRMAKSNAKFYFSDVTLSCFRIHNNSKSILLKTKHLTEARQVRTQIRGRKFSMYERYIIVPFTKLKKRLLGFKLKIEPAATLKRPSEEVRRYFDYDAAKFAKVRWLGSGVARQDYKITTVFLQDFLEVDATDHVLEIGCGPGVWTNIISEQCHHITAVDISDNMIEQAKNRVKNKNVTFCQSDFSEFQSDDSYDKIFSVRVIEYFQDPAKVAAKMFSFSKTGGRAIIITKTFPTLITVRAKLWQYLKRLLPKKHGIFTEAVPPMKMIPPWKLKRIFIACGYKEVEVYPVILRLPLFIHNRYPLPLVKEEVQKGYEQSMLIFFNKLARKTRFMPSILRWIFLPFSETYLIDARK